jgi:hypothetical protein
MTNLNRAYEVNNGIVINEDGAYLTSGSSSPVGLDLPVRTIYLQLTASGLIYWRKFAAGVNDWRQLSAQDIPFDNTIAQFPNNPQDIQAALEESRGARFQYVQFQRIGQMNFDQYLFAGLDQGNTNRESGDTSNGYQFTGSAPQTVAFTGTVDNATASIRGIAQSTGTPAANLELLFELWRVGFTGEGTKIGDITFNIDTSLYTIGNWWNSSIVTGFAEEQDQTSNSVSVIAGDLLGLKFIRRTGNQNVVSVENTTIVLEITGNA